MENTLLDRQILEQTADALIAQKYPGQPAETLSNERENIIQGLDDAVGQSVVDALNPEQLDRYSELLETEKEDPSVFEKFFSDNQINLEEVIKTATENFVKQYLGGGNE